MDGEGPEEKDTDIREEITPGCYIKARHTLALMGFLGMFNLYSLRTNLSVAIVAMVNLTRRHDSMASNVTICPDRGGSEITNSSQFGTFSWNTAEQGLLLGCYYYGYIFTCMPGGYLTKRFGVQVVLGTSMLFSSIITLLFPVVAYSNFSMLVACRILLGFLQGVTSPAIVSAWGKWAPPPERSFLISFPIAGASFGTFITLPLAGIIADNLGWEAVFHITGGFALLWSIVWCSIIRSSPQEHPRISDEEKKYIIQSIGYDKAKQPGIKYCTPWKGILTSPRVWAIAAGHFASNWGNYTLNAMLPTYMATVLRFNLSAVRLGNANKCMQTLGICWLRQSGELSALPFVLQSIFAIGGGYITDVIRSRHLMSTIAIRKLNTTLGLAVPGVSIVLAGYIGCDFKAAVAFFSISVAFNALTIPGCKANTVDIAPKYGGIIYGISNTIANIPGFLAPQVVGIMLLDNDSLSQWQAVFWVSAAIYLMGAITYLVLGTAEVQPWASGSSTLQEESEDVGEQCEEEFP